MRKIFGSFIGILLLVSMASAGNITIDTDKKIYEQGEIVQFTLYNNGSISLEIDFKPSILNDTGKCIWGCYWAAVYNPITIISGENYSWTWDQRSENGNATSGYYKGVLGGYYSNDFEIITISQDKLLTYYRELGQFPDIVETSDLLKAADDWRDGIVPHGFYLSITTNQLLILLDEWRNQYK